MIRRLRIRITCIIMSILTFVFAYVVSVFNYASYTEQYKQSNQWLHSIIQREGHLAPGNIRYSNDVLDFCYISLDSNNKILSFSSSSDVYDQAQIESLLSEALALNTDSGQVGNHQRFLLIRSDTGSSIAFLDRSAAYKGLYRVLFFSITTVLILLAILTFLCAALSKWLVRPVERAFAQQKQFISDASHELKTPLSVISANADVLADEIGENPYLSYIRSETYQMNHLVQDLLTLTRLESVNTESPEDFDLSCLVLQSALPFESTVFEAGKTLQLDVKDGISLSGYPDKIRQLVGILLDNAIKYSNNSGLISLNLYASRGNPVLEVYNTGRGITPEEQKNIFERFYRGDSCRCRNSGSYGLGLSIAHSITALHNARIIVESEPGEYVRFKVFFKSSS